MIGCSNDARLFCWILNGSSHFQDDPSGGRLEKSSSPAGDSNKIRSSNASNSGSESPKPARKRFGSIENDLDVSRVNGDASSGATSEQLEALKQEILREMRKEMTKMKQEIIDGERLCRAITDDSTAYTLLNRILVNHLSGIC